MMRIYYTRISRINKTAPGGKHCNRQRHRGCREIDGPKTRPRKFWTTIPRATPFLCLAKSVCMKPATTRQYRLSQQLFTVGTVFFSWSYDLSTFGPALALCRLLPLSSTIFHCLFPQLCGRHCEPRIYRRDTPVLEHLLGAPGTNFSP